MGIKYLNSYLKRTCCDVLPQIPLWKLRGKKISIDASIYMYRYAADDALMEGMYQMTMLLLDNLITPLYVFDGAPPPEKMDLIKQRSEARIRAKYNLANMEDKMDVKKAKMYKRQSTSIHRRDVDNVKEMLTACGVTWYQASGEADQLCVQLVKNNEAWACMSDDTDMLVYGCERVLRYVSLFNQTVVMYNLPDILANLGIQFADFQKICVLSGTDYRKGKNLYSVITRYSKGDTVFLNDADTTMFKIPSTLSYKVNVGTSSNRHKLRSVLKRHGFVFVNET